MKILDFIQTKEFFILNGLKCLRGDYYHNNCNNCIDICPSQSVTIMNKKIFLENSCTNCGVCIGICPTESLMLENFDENNFVLEFSQSQTDEISCKSNSICLSTFDEHHYISMIMNKKKDFKVDISHCENCDLNCNNLETSISNRVTKSNEFLELLDVQNKIELKKETQKELNVSRRGIFEKVFKATKQIKDNQNLTKKIEEKIDKKIPTKKLLLKNRIKEFLTEEKLINFENNIICNKNIDYEKCTNCKECVQFCPTEALSKNSLEDTIYFQIGKCINCNICNDICKEKAISTNYKDINLLNFAFDKAVILAQFNMKICTKCKCAYPSKNENDKQICHICKKFDTEYEDLFIMQKDL
jgi:ferredoxin